MYQLANDAKRIFADASFFPSFLKTKEASEERFYRSIGP